MVKFDNAPNIHQNNMASLNICSRVNIRVLLHGRMAQWKSSRGSGFESQPHTTRVLSEVKYEAEWFREEQTVKHWVWDQSLDQALVKCGSVLNVYHYECDTKSEKWKQKYYVYNNIWLFCHGLWDAMHFYCWVKLGPRRKNLLAWIWFTLCKR